MVSYPSYFLSHLASECVILVLGGPVSSMQFRGAGGRGEQGEPVSPLIALGQEIRLSEKPDFILIALLDHVASLLNMLTHHRAKLPMSPASASVGASQRPAG